MSAALHQRLRSFRCIDFDVYGLSRIVPPHLVLAAGGFCLSIAAFLEWSVLPHAQPRITYLVGCLVCLAAYPILHYAMKLLVPPYASLSDRPKQMYVVSNLLKSVVLACMCPSVIRLLYHTMWLDDWSTVYIRNMGSLYAMTDVVSLLVVRRMQRSTKIHHITVALFHEYTMHVDYSMPGVPRLIMVYACFSTFAYLVNALLASRFLNVSDVVSRVLSLLALVIYSACCLLNWTWQVHAIYELLVRPLSSSTATWYDWLVGNWSVLAYVGAMAMIIMDDVLLNQWLLFNLRRKVVLVEKKKE